MSRGRIRAISVDLDGTLYRVRRLRVAWRLRSDRGLLVAYMAAREKLRHEPDQGTATELFRREAELVAPSFGLTVDEAERQLSALRSRLPEALTRGARPFAGVRSALEAARARGVKLAVLSDYSPAGKLDRLGLADLGWSAEIGVETVGALKPHRRAFEALVAALGEPPEAILHVGDREDLDVEGALAAGLRAWRFSARGPRPSKAERVFERWGVGLFAPIVD